MEHLIGLFDPRFGDSGSESDFDFEEFGELDQNKRSDDALPLTFPPEEFYGAVEYKRQLIKPTRKRLM